MPLYLQYILIGVSGALGTLLRFFLARSAILIWGDAFPWGTILINICGCFLIGFIMLASGPQGRWPIGDVTRQLLTIGFLGGFTTFSAFAFQTWSLAQTESWSAFLNVALSVCGCLAAVWLGAGAALYFNKH